MKTWLRTRLAPLAAAGLMRGICASLRWEIEEEYAELRKADRPPVIFAFWHNRLFVMPSLYRMVAPRHPVAVLISQSRDGQLIADIVRQFRMHSARGSSSRQGSAGFRELVRLMTQENHDVSMTPDGPRGPRYQLQNGVLALSQMTGFGIVPVSCELGRKKEMRSWDAFQIPYPGTICRVRFGRPVHIPPEADAAALADYAEKLHPRLG